jgi:hypothetical protein
MKAYFDGSIKITQGIRAVIFVVVTEQAGKEDCIEYQKRENTPETLLIITLYVCLALKKECTVFHSNQ